MSTDRTDPVARTRELLAAAMFHRPTLIAAAPTLLTELADACEAKDAEIERLRKVEHAAEGVRLQLQGRYTCVVCGKNGQGHTEVCPLLKLYNALAALSDTGGEG